MEQGSVTNNLIDFTDILLTILETGTERLSETLKTDGLVLYAQMLGKETEIGHLIFVIMLQIEVNSKRDGNVQNKNWNLYGNDKFYNL